MKKLYTPDGERLTGQPWQVYPRPQMRRKSYVNLNGQWDFTVNTSDALPEAYDLEIRVPFCPESLLSGLDMAVPPGSWLHYRKRVQLETSPGKRWLLHIGAADQIARVWCNGVLLGGHTGGYTAFTVDITQAVQKDNELVIQVYDDLRDKTLPYGKQSLNRGGMWYTPVSGIWQTVWLEQVPEQYIQRLDMEVNLRSAKIRVTPALTGSVVLEGRWYPLQRGEAEVFPEHPRRWTPEDPYLYGFSVVTEQDRVDSYFALRTLEIKKFKGFPHLCLNGEPFFFHGLLDQGYWSDGIYTPATPEIMEWEVARMKDFGFNTLRKHIKVEPEYFYYTCDRLGMVVFQDMVNNSRYSFLRDTLLPTFGIQKLEDKGLHKDADTRAAFLQCMTETVAQLRNHPCICYWTIFNEGWGQFASEDCYEKLKAMDSSRFIDSTSGWFRRKKSDVDSRHLYFGSLFSLKPGKKKPMVLSEYGGFACPVSGHMANPKKAFGYRLCRNPVILRIRYTRLYENQMRELVWRHLSGAILTQVSDVEDEINGVLTYDRREEKMCVMEMNYQGWTLTEYSRRACGLPRSSKPWRVWRWVSIAESTEDRSDRISLAADAGNPKPDNPG